MQIFRRFRFFTGSLLIFSFLFSPSFFTVHAKEKTLNTAIVKQQQQQRLIESIDIQGNRRLRDEDLLYYIQSRPGDALSQPQLERDLQVTWPTAVSSRSRRTSWPGWAVPATTGTAALVTPSVSLAPLSVAGVRLNPAGTAGAVRSIVTENWSDAALMLPAGSVACAVKA
jgi:hypothetical protein